MNKNWKHQKYTEESIKSLLLPLCVSMLYIFMISLVCFSVAVIYNMNKCKMKRKGFISCYRLQSITQGSQGRNSKPDLEAETTKEHCLQPCSQAHIQLHRQPGPTCPRMAPQSDGPSYFSQQLCPIDMPTGQSGRVSSSAENFSSQLC